MNIVKLNGYDEVYNAFNDLKDVFPILTKRVEFSDYVKKLSEYANVYSIVENNEHIGIAAVYMNDYDSFIAFLSLIGISHQHRKKGLGKQLLIFCENEAKNAGMKALKLEVKKDNKPANAMYKSMGYSFVGESDSGNNYLQKPLD